jgi:hypothetical protein
MKIKEIENSLPNGFHDSSINCIKIDFAKKEAEIDTCKNEVQKSNGIKL